MNRPARTSSRLARSLSPAACLSVCLLAACSSTKESKNEGAPVEREEMQVTVTGADATREGDTLKIEYPVLKDKNDRIPDWVINPSLGGVTGAVGVASTKKMGTREQIEEARRSARLELAAMLEARLQQVGREELEENMRVASGERGEQSRKSTLRVSRDILDTVLAGTRQRALWFDPENSECYVWMVMDGRILQSVEHRVVDSVSVFVANQAISQEYRPERRKPEVPKVIVEAPDQPVEQAAPEPPKTPVEKLEGNLKPIQTIPIKEGEAKKSGSGS